MTRPMDPDNIPDGNSEFSWGPGMFPPGVANSEGQRVAQDDFGENMYPPVLRAKDGAHVDNYARAVADRRTDSLDPESGRDFETLGNPDRYGGAPQLVQGQRERNVSHREEPPQAKLRRER